MIGQTIDRYRIVEELGQGGMGVVYKARDTLLDRFVALKFLPPDKSSDSERRRRFLHEAKSASALNHPGIVAVHDVLSVDGQDVLVMELVEGETLESVLSRKRLPLGRGLGIAIGIADALARAHASGIVHRDLKPANVMVTSDGVKVLDFGLAKPVEAAYVDPESPTIAPDESSLTHERAILGTVPWMSPEQASGEPVDARSDIFAFGVLLYELFTGQHPFRRGTSNATLIAIRNEDPVPPTTHVPTLPPEAERAVLRCLHKNPTHRWQSLSDLGAVLEDLKEDTESGRRIVTEPPATRWRIHPALVAAVAATIAAAISLVALLNRNEPPAVTPLALSRLTYDAGAGLYPAISPDGNLVAFSSDREGNGDLDIWVRHINRPEPVRLTDHPGNDQFSRFSPDGSLIVFTSNRDGGGIFVINALGGEERKITGPGMFPQFSPDGADVVYVADEPSAPGGLFGMYRVPVDGGTPEPVVQGFGVWRSPRAAGPVFSPDGTLIMFRGAPRDDPGKDDWWLARYPDGEPYSSGTLDAFPQIDVVQFPSLWLPGRLLFLAGTTIEGINLYSTKISDDGMVSGPPRPLTAGPGMTWVPSVSKNGRIALARFSWVIHLWEVSLDPASGRPTGPPNQITDDAAPKISLSLDRSGDRLAYSAFAGPREKRRAEVRLQDRVTGEESIPISFDAIGLAAHPNLSPDGSQMTWRALSGGKWTTFVVPIGEPVGRELCTDCRVISFFSGGDEILVRRGQALSRLRIADGEETPVLEIEDARLLDSDLSADDRSIALLVGEPKNTMKIYAVDINERASPHASWIEVVASNSYIGAPRWSIDGRFLYYLSDRDDFLCVWATPVDPMTKIPNGEAFPVAHAHSTKLSMARAQRSAWVIDVARDRLVFNAGELSGEIYTAMLEP